MTKCGLNQAQLAEVMEVKLQRIRDLSSGRAKKLTREESERLVGKLDIRADWLVTGKGPMLQDDEPQEVFVDRMRAINQMVAVIQALPLNETAKMRLGALMSGDPVADAQLIAEALQCELASSPVLKPDEAALLDNYRNSPKEAQDALKATSAALAKQRSDKRSA